MMKPMILTLSAAALLLLCSCSEDETGGTGEMPSGGPQRAGMEVLGASTGALQSETRAVTYIPITSGSIGVYLNPKNPGEYDVKKNVKYTASIVEGVPVWSSNDPLFFTKFISLVCAYHPYVSGVSYEDCKTIPLSSQEFNAAYDLSFATNTYMNATLGTATGTESGAGNKVKFTMQRAYALIELNFKRGNLKDDVTISKIELSGMGLKSACKLDISSATYNDFIDAQDNKIILVKDISLPKNTSATPVRQQMLMVPILNSMPDLSDLKLTLTMKSAGSSTVSTSVTGISKFEAGKKYILNLTVNSTSVNLSDLQVEIGWTDEAMADSNGNTTLKPQ